MKKLKVLLGSMAASLGLMLAPALASAANGYSLFGEASKVSPGNASSKAIKTVSDNDPGYGGIDFDVTAGLTFADLQTLGTDFNVTDDNCGGGSPRFQVNVDTGSGIKNIFVYLGPAPGYNTCPSNTWVTSGDLLEGVNPIDTSQLPGGTFYDPYSVALAKYSSYPVVGIQLVTDAGWSQTDGEQTVLFDNTVINTKTYTYETLPPATKDECKNDGWQNFDGMFKNQGDCVSFVATKGKNQPANASSLSF